MAITDTNLVVRYRINEAASGQAPTTLVDEGPLSADLSIANYGGSNMNFVTESGRIGLRNTSYSGDQRALLSTPDGHAVRTAIEGGNKFTFELVYDHGSGFSSGARIFGFNGQNGENGSLILKSEGAEIYLAWNNVNYIYAGLTPTAGINRIWIVVDTTQATAADRVKVSLNGSALANTAQAIGLNSTSTFNTDTDLIIFNRGATWSRSPIGALFYAALYNDAFDDARIAAHDADLSVGDDTPSGGGVTGQLAFPDADISAGAWSPSTGSTLYEVLAVESDVDSILATTNTVADVGLEPLDLPEAGDQILTYRAFGSPAKALKVGLYEGTTLLEEWTTDPLAATVTPYARTLAVGINDGSDLRVKFTSQNAASPPAPSISFVAVGTGANGSTSVNVNTPAGAINDVLVLHATGGSTADATPATPSGWTSQGSYASTDGAFGIDAGPRRVTVFTKVATQAATEVVNIATTGGNTTRGTVTRYAAAHGSSTWDIAATGGADSTSGTGFSVTGGALSFAPGDKVLVTVGQRLDSATQSAQSLTASGITFSARTGRASVAVTRGNDHRHVIDEYSVTAGTASVAPTWAYTASGAVSGGCHVLRIREVLSTTVSVTQLKFNVPDAAPIPDTTAPGLSNVVLTSVLGTTARGGVDTTEAGPSWAVCTLSATKPSDAEVKAGLDHLGVAAPNDTAALAIGTNVNAYNFSGLTIGETRYLHVVQDDEVTPTPNTSTVESSAGVVMVAPTTISITYLHFGDSVLRLKQASAPSLSEGTMIWRERRFDDTGAYAGGIIIAPGDDAWYGGYNAVMPVTHRCPGTFNATTGQRDPGASAPNRYYEIAGVDDGTGQDRIASESAHVLPGETQESYQEVHGAWYKCVLRWWTDGSNVVYEFWADWDLKNVIRVQAPGAFINPTYGGSPQCAIGTVPWAVENFNGDIFFIKQYSAKIATNGEIDAEFDNFTDTSVQGSLRFSNIYPELVDVSGTMTVLDNSSNGNVFVLNSVGSPTALIEDFEAPGSTAAAPVVVTHPADSSIAIGAQATFNVSFTGDPEPTAQWQYLLPSPPPFPGSVTLDRTGGDDYLYRDATGFDYNDVYTFFSWVKIVTDPNDYQHFINLSPAIGYSGDTDFIGTNNDGSQFRYGCAGGSSDSFLTGSYLGTDTWYWVAMVRESATSLKIYLGQLGSGGALIDTLTNDVSGRSPPAGIMSLGGFSAYNLNGRVASSRVWSGQALTLVQLDAEADSPSPVVTTGLWTAPNLGGVDMAAALVDTSGNSRDWLQNGTGVAVNADAPSTTPTWANVIDGTVTPSSFASQFVTEIVSLDDTGTKYRAVLTNSEGSATSNEALLTVTEDYLGILGSVILATTGSGYSGPGILYNFVDPGDEDKFFYFTLITDVTLGGTLTLYADGTFDYSGPPDVFVIQVFKNNVSLGTFNVYLKNRRRVLLLN